MDFNNSDCIKNNDNETFKFFEKTKKRKTSKRSPKSNKNVKPISFVLPKRRTTRLKTNIFVETYPETLPDGEFDISKEDFSSSTLKFEPLKKKIKLSNATLENDKMDDDELIDETDSAMENGRSKNRVKRRKIARKSKSSEFENMADKVIKNYEINDELNGTDSNMENGHIEKPMETKRVNEFENIAYNAIESIDTNAIIEMLKDTSLENVEDEQETKLSKTCKRNLNETDYCDNNLNESLILSNNDATKTNKVFEKNKKQGKKSNTEKIKESNVKKQTNNSDSGDMLYDYEPEIKCTHLDTTCDLFLNESLIVSDNESTKSDNVSEQPKKRGRKSNAEKLKITNIKKQTINSDLGDMMRNTEPEMLLTSNDNNSDNALNKSINGSDPQRDLANNGHDCSKSVDVPKQPKKRGRKSNAEKLKEAELANKSGLKNVLQDTDGNKSLAANDDMKKSGNITEQPKKRGRKPKCLNTTSVDTSSNKVNNNILNYFNVKDKQVDKTTNSPKKNIAQSDNSATVFEDNIQGTPNGNEAIESPATISTRRKTRSTSKVNDSLTASKQRETRRNKSNIIDTTDSSLGLDNLDKDADFIPRKRGRPIKSISPRVVKVNVAKKLQKKTFIKFSKLTKEQIKQGTFRKIPKQRLEEVLEMIADDDHPVWEDRNISCNPSIYRHWTPQYSGVSGQNIKLKYARQFLLRRDWMSLSKILYLSNTDAKMYYPLLAKYATLLLAHTDEEQFDKCIQFLTSMNDSKEVIKKCTKISNDNED